VSLARLLTDSATVVRFTPGDDDPRGDGDVGTWTDVGAYSARFQQQTSTETLDGRDTSTADWLVILPAAADVQPRDRIRDQHGQTFEVDGVPARPTRPGTGVHHIEARLRYVTD
jgi:hypothetical protein